MVPDMVAMYAVQTQPEPGDVLPSPTFTPLVNPDYLKEQIREVMEEMKGREETTVQCECPVEVWEDYPLGIWVSWCRALDIYSQGNTRDEAVAAIKSAVNLHFRHSR
jgi:hypothetical protein